MTTFLMLLLLAVTPPLPGSYYENEGLVSLDLILRKKEQRERKERKI